MARPAPRLALFDLDNTLLAGDSDHAWGEFLISRGIVDEAEHRAKNDAFYEQYVRGELDIHGYVAFTLEPILSLAPAALNTLRQEFVTSEVAAIMLPKAISLVNSHRDAGDLCVIITATNEFITQPIAAAFGVEHLIATGTRTNRRGNRAALHRRDKRHTVLPTWENHEAKCLARCQSSRGCWRRPTRFARRQYSL